MAGEASQRQFRSSRNKFIKFAKDFSAQICNTSFDDENYDTEVDDFEKLYQAALTDGQAYRSTLGEHEDDEAKVHRDQYDTDFKALEAEYNKVKNELSLRITRVSASQLRNPPPVATSPPPVATGTPVTAEFLRSLFDRNDKKLDTMNSQLNSKLDGMISKEEFQSGIDLVKQDFREGIDVVKNDFNQQIVNVHSSVDTKIGAAKDDILKEVRSLCNQRDHKQTAFFQGPRNSAFNDNYFREDTSEDEESIRAAETSFSYLPGQKMPRSTDFENNNVAGASSSNMPPLVDTVAGANTKLSYNGRDFIPRGKDPLSQVKLEQSQEDNSNNYAAFIFKHGLVTDSTYKFNGDALQYVEFVCYFHNNYMSIIEDKNILFIRLLDMLEGPALQAVQFCRYERGDRSLHRALDILKGRFGRPELIRNAHESNLKGGRPVKDNFESLSTFLTELMSYEMVKRYFNPHAVTYFYSSDLIESLMQRLPKSLSSSFLKYIQRKGLLEETSRHYVSLIHFIENRVITLQTPLGRNILSNKGNDGFKRSKPRHFGKEGSFSAPVGEGSPGGGSGGGGSRDSDKTPRKCSYCGEGHSTYRCHKFRKLSLSGRVDFVFKNHICFACLEKGHMIGECPKRFTKPGCKRSHHFLLCDCNISTTSSSAGFVDPASDNQVVAGSANVDMTGARLKVLPVRLHGPSGSFLTVYGMIDDGSQNTLISEEICEKLGIDGQSKSIVMSTSSGDDVPMTVKTVDFNISDKCGSTLYGIAGAYSVKKLPSLGDDYPCVTRTSETEHIADLAPHFPTLPDNRLHIIIGVKETDITEVVEKRNVPPGKLKAGKTKLGWIIYGSTKTSSTHSTVNCNFSRITNEMLDRRLDR